MEKFIVNRVDGQNISFSPNIPHHFTIMMINKKASKSRYTNINNKTKTLKFKSMAL